jgi:hypothetical protein
MGNQRRKTAATRKSNWGQTFNSTKIDFPAQPFQKLEIDSTQKLRSMI